MLLLKRVDDLIIPALHRILIYSRFVKKVIPCFNKPNLLSRPLVG